MADMSATGEKDPYMQAYITARMKNQVEEMKLQKVLASMEVSQRVRKIMLNLELFEDRKVAHKLQKEVSTAASRKRQAMTRFVRQKNNQAKAQKWLSSYPADQRSEPSPKAVSGDSNSHTVPHPPSAPLSGKRAVYPVTKVKDYYENEQEDKFEGEGEGLPRVAGKERVKGAWTKASSFAPRRNLGSNIMPAITVTESSSGNGGKDLSPTEAALAAVAAAQKAGEGGGGEEGKLTTPKPHPSIHDHSVPPRGEGVRTAQPSSVTKTATFITPPPTRTHSQPHPRHHHHQEEQQPYGQHPTAAAVAQHNGRTAGNIQFPPVTRTRSTRTRATHSNTRTNTTGEEKKKQRLTSASKLWPGDPQAIGSVRRDRRNVEEMLSTMKSGEETRRLIREAVPTCSRNCNKPNILVLMERTYVNLPELMPEIRKARERMALDEAIARDFPPTTTQSLDQPRDGSSSTQKRAHKGRFSANGADEQNSKPTPPYQIDYSSLRDSMRRPSVLA